MIILIPLRLQQLKKRFGLGLINLRICVNLLKISKFSEFRRLEVVPLNDRQREERILIKVVLD